MSFMFDERLKVAYDKSNEVLEELDYDVTKMVSTQDIIDIVERKVDCRILVSEISFSDVSEKLKDYGAMMWTELNSNGQRIANIVLNKDNDSEFQRFSLVHELGHLMTVNSDDLFVEDEKYIVSTHIDYRVTNISKEEYENNEFLLGEQYANVFALRILMPERIFFKKIKELDRISQVARFFGLTDEAVLSRIMLII